MVDSHLSTGMATLDRVFRGLLPGDNLVWQVDTIGDFAPFAGPYCRAAQQAGRRLVYFRFAEHPPLASERNGATVCELPSCAGFEKFITQIRRTIREAGRGAFFLFDCLSALAEEWCSDRMLGNFFMLTCPYVYDLESLAYFPLLRSVHSLQATTPIARTTQMFINVYRHKGAPVHPAQQSRASLFAHHVHAARLGGRPLCAGDREFDHRRNPHVDALGRAGFSPLPPGQLEPHLPEGRADLGRDAARRDSRRRSGRLVPYAGADGVHPRRAMAGHGGAVPDARRHAGDLEADDRHGTDRRQVGGHAAGPRDPPHDASPLARIAGSPRLVLHRIRRVLLVSGRERLLVAPPEAARSACLSGRHRGGSPPDHHRDVSRQRDQGLCRDAGLLRPVADHRAVQQPLGGQLRQRVCRQVRKRVLRQSGLAPETAGGFRRGRQDDLCQHDERKGAPLPGAARAAGPGRTDAAVGPACLGQPARQPVLPADRGRRFVGQSLCLEQVHRSVGRHGPPGVRSGHAGGGSRRRRLYPRRGLE